MDAEKTPTKPHPGGGKPHKADREAILADVENAILVTGSSKKAVALIVAKHGIPRRTAQDHAMAVRERWREEALERGVDRQAMLDEHRSRMFQIYQTAMKIGQTAVAHKVAITLAQLDGFLTTIAVAATVRHEHVNAEQYAQADAILRDEGWTPPPKARA